MFKIWCTSLVSALSYQCGCNALNFASNGAILSDKWSSERLHWHAYQDREFVWHKRLYTGSKSEVDYSTQASVKGEINWKKKTFTDWEKDWFVFSEANGNLPLLLLFSRIAWVQGPAVQSLPFLLVLRQPWYEQKYRYWLETSPRQQVVRHQGYPLVFERN